MSSKASLKHFLPVQKTRSARSTGKQQLTTPGAKLTSTSTTTSKKLELLQEPTRPVKKQKKLELEVVINANDENTDSVVNVPLTPKEDIKGKLTVESSNEPTTKVEKTDTPPTEKQSTVPSSKVFTHVSPTKDGKPIQQRRRTSKSNMSVTSSSESDSDVPRNTAHIHPLLPATSVTSTPAPTLKRKFSTVSPINNANMKMISTTTASPEPTSTAMPAFQKHAALITPGTRLPLPRHYETLANMFNALEYTLFFLKSKGQHGIYHKLRRPVENICHRNFELKFLQQIRTIYPEAYKMYAVKTIENGTRVLSYCLEILPTHSTKKDAKNANAWTDAQQLSKSLQQRKQVFFDRLLKLVRQHHVTFLEKNGYDSAFGNGLELKSWHPKFLLDEVPAPEEAVLPELLKPIGVTTSLLDDKKKDGDNIPTGNAAAASVPVEDRVAVKSEDVKSVLKAFRDKYPSSQKNEEEEDKESKPAVATTEPEKVEETKPQQQQQQEQEEITKKPLSRASSLLERIKQKQKAAMEAKMFSQKIDPALLKKRSMYSRLPDVAQILLL